MVAVTTEMTPDEFKAWMEENAFDNEMLASALGVHEGSVIRWRNGRHPVTRLIKLALDRLGENRGARRERRRALDVGIELRSQLRTGESRQRIDTARQRALAATNRAA